MLQIIDISGEIMYNVAQGEKTLLSLINATVSHEMRNPSNSIRCQNLLQRQLNEKINDLLNSNITSVKKMK